MTPNYALLHRCGEFSQIKEWFTDTHGIEVCFFNVVYVEMVRNSYWEGLVTFYADDEYCDATERRFTELFANTKIEVRFRNSIRPMHMLETQYIWRFVMLADEWPSLLMMQELSRDPD